MLHLSRRAMLGLLMLPAAAEARIFATHGAALGGTDVVGYFTEGRVVRGRTEHLAEWQGARWLFASAASRERFLADPAAYLPAYGGFCAWAVAHGYIAPTDPVAWRIVEGRLYLNYDRGVQRRWETDIPGHIARGDANWPRLREG